MDCVKVDAVSSQRSPYKPAQSAALPAAFHLLNSRPPARMSLARQGTHGDSRGIKVRVRNTYSEKAAADG